MTVLVQKVCFFGAGAIGCYLAAHTARAADAEVSILARGESVTAIRQQGVRVVRPGESFRTPVRVAADPSELGPQDVLFITLKAHQVSAALPSIVPLLKPDTTVISPTTGLPYWFFHRAPDPWTDRRLTRLDPGGLQWDTLTAERAIGCTYWIGAELLEPGVVRQDGSEAGFPIGEPDGSRSARLTRLHRLMTDGGLRAPMRDSIRGDIWIKLVNSLVWNPIACLTRADLGRIGESPGVVATARAIMQEVDLIASTLAIPVPVPMEKRIAATLANRSHKMSMLQDLLRGRTLELEPLMDSVAELKEMARMPTPITDSVLSLAALMERGAAESRAETARRDAAEH